MWFEQIICPTPMTTIKVLENIKAELLTTYLTSIYYLFTTFGLDNRRNLYTMFILSKLQGSVQYWLSQYKLSKNGTCYCNNVIIKYSEPTSRHSHLRCSISSVNSNVKLMCTNSYLKYHRTIIASGNNAIKGMNE